MKATKKPVTIECMKWNGVNFDEIKEFCGDVAEFNSCIESGCDELFIKTLKGYHKATAGDYIIKGVKGEFYPCKPDIFAQTYDIVDSDSRVREFVETEIHFQEGPIKECGVNGVCIEDLLVMVIRRLEGFQNSEFKCRENACAITKLEEALLWLRKRTMGRENRGVEGTNKE